MPIFELLARWLRRRPAPAPESAEAHFNLGNANYEAGNHAEAIASYQRALALRPDLAEAYINLGNVLNDLHRGEEAVANYRSALALRPGFADGHFNLGNALDDLGRHEEAVASYRSALALQPGFADAYNNLGGALSELRRHEEAIASCRSALALRPDFAEAHNNLARALNDVKRYEEAMASCRSVLAIKPGFAGAHSNLGTALSGLKRYEEAIASCREALVIQPDLAEAHGNLGIALSALDRHEEAIASCQRALAIGPDLAEAHNNLGNVLNACNRHEEAIACYQRALALKPGLADAHNNLGYTLNALGRYEEAIVNFENALALQPDMAEAHLNQSLALLTIGDFERGWVQHEWRRRTKDHAPKIGFVQPLWLGAEDLSGRTILLHNEQGFGDTLHFLRYAPLVAARGARVVLEVQRPLKALAEGLAGPNAVVAEGDPRPDFDYQCPFMSLPLAFGTNLQSIPGETPYLHAAPARVAKWQAILGERTGLRIGLAWSGNRAHKNDRNRSIALSRLLPLLSVPGVRFVGLQKELREEDAEALGKISGFTHLGDQFEDFADTAAVVSLLDLVISVDSAVAHLTGALGKPVWVLLPFSVDWRWLLGREDNPWYPSARLFRQPEIGDWDSVIARVRSSLAAMSAEAQRPALDPDSAEAHNNLGVSLTDSGRIEEAIESYRRALALKPDFADFHFNLGYALDKAGRREDAIASYQRALALNPDSAETHHNLGKLLHDAGRHAEAIASYQRARAIRPGFAEAHYRLGLVLDHLKRHEEAVASYRKALALRPDSAESHNNLGIALSALNRHEEAIASYQRALALQPGLAEAHGNSSYSLLSMGDMERGWEQYEWRWAAKDFGPKRDFARPRWRGAEDLSGKTILLHNEQGFGDTLQFLRYAPLVAARGARVVLEVQRPIKALAESLAGPNAVVAEGDPLPDFDYQCPLLSLPLAFGTNLQSIPGETPYLHPAPDRLAKWQAILGEGAGFRVGLAWSGNRIQKNDHNRSMALARLLPLLSVPGVRFVSLQKEPREEDAQVLGNVSGLTHLGGQLEDFADTAAAVSLLDLVISVDSAVAHLAGALGKPVWVLLSFAADWRWLLEREDNPWYPSARLFRQPKIGDWDRAVERVREELLRLASGAAAGSAMQPPEAQGVRNMPLAQALEEAFNTSERGDSAAGRPSRLQLRTGGDDFDALHLLRVLGARQGRAGEAIEIVIDSLRRNPGSAEAHVLLIACAWPELAPVTEALRERVTKGKSGEISPLGLLPLPESGAGEQLLCARQYAERQYGEFLHLPPLCGTEPRATRDRLRIGYLSGDYHEHPVSYLVAEVIERHDRGRFEVFGYSYGPDSEGPMRKRMRAAFGVFREIRPLSHEAAARQILDDRIDILVDLTGYTSDTRLEILALRPAPVQVGWLGYAGTLGHPRLADYMIGDPVASPLVHAAHYGEILALLPNCFQPNDRQRAVEAAPQRTAAGLPAQGFVFCCFNQSYKITARIFDLWCRLLASVPGSVLWLAQPVAAAEHNLRREALARGVAPERLIFAPRTPTLAGHFARLQCADLALDTYPYTSHTTASDALWAGVPLVTLRGETFASRVAASILHAAQLPELITDSEQQCYELVLDLATHPDRLAQIRARLAANRLSCPLFDSERFTLDLERLFRRMWGDYLAGARQPIVLGPTC